MRGVCRVVTVPSVVRRGAEFLHFQLLPRAGPGSPGGFSTRASTAPRPGASNSRGHVGWAGRHNRTEELRETVRPTIEGPTQKSKLPVCQTDSYCVIFVTAGFRQTARSRGSPGPPSRFQISMETPPASTTPSELESDSTSQTPHEPPRGGRQRGSPNFTLAETSGEAHSATT
jgi:hypothetical protein